MKIIVTGGAGFIGSHIAEFLSGRHEVTVIDDLSTGHRRNLEKVPVKFVKGSLLDRPLLHAEFRDAGIVVHQAALPSVHESVLDPRRTHQVNVTGTLNTLCAARDAGVEKVIFASSASVYGNAPAQPKREDMVPEPASPYAASKLAGEHYCRSFTAQYGVKTVCLRYFNVYGPRQDPDSAYAGVVPRFITQMLSDKPLTVHGGGTQTRDFIFVKDVVDAVHGSIARDCSGTFNIGSGTRTSINDLIALLLRRIETKSTLSHLPALQGDIRDSVADIALARALLGFAPAYSIERGLDATIEWFRARRDGAAGTVRS